MNSTMLDVAIIAWLAMQITAAWVGVIFLVEHFMKGSKE